MKKPPQDATASASFAPKAIGTGLDGDVSQDRRYSGFNGLSSSLSPNTGSPETSVRPDTVEPALALPITLSQWSSTSGWDSMQTLSLFPSAAIYLYASSEEGKESISKEPSPLISSSSFCPARKAYTRERSEFLSLGALSVTVTLTPLPSSADSRLAITGRKQEYGNGIMISRFSGSSAPFTMSAVVSLILSQTEQDSASFSTPLRFSKRWDGCFFSRPFHP